MKVIRFLLKIPKMVFSFSYSYLILFVFALFIFAVVYNSNENDFYHSTLPLEQTTSDLLLDIKDNIYDDVRTNFIGLYENDEIYLDENQNWIFNIEDLQIIDFEINSNQIQIKFYAIAKFDNKIPETPNFIDAGLVFSIYFYNDNPFIRSIDTEGDYSKYWFSYDSIEFPSHFESLENIDVSKIFNEETDGGYIVITTNGLNTDKIDAYRQSIKGIPTSYNERGFLRYLYFSGVTITTLGYGDIVPITNSMRFLVTVESVLGILLLAVFVSMELSRISSNRFRKRITELNKPFLEMQKDQEKGVLKPISTYYPIKK